MSLLKSPMAQIARTIHHHPSTFHRNGTLQHISATLQKRRSSISSSSKVSIKKHDQQPSTNPKHNTIHCFQNLVHCIPQPQSQRSFHTSTRSRDNSSNPIDLITFPSLSHQPLTSPGIATRMPLSPDNVRPRGTSLDVEDDIQGVSRRGMMEVIAAKPEQVSAASIAVVGNEGLGGTEDHVVLDISSTENEVVREMGAIRQIWSDLISDVWLKLSKFT